MAMQREIPCASEEEIPLRGSEKYYTWLTKRSCKNFMVSTRSGTINSTEDTDKLDYMFNKKIKMLLCDCDLAIFLVTEDGEVYHWWDVVWADPSVKYYFSHYIDLRDTRFELTASGCNSTFIALTQDHRIFYFETFGNMNTIQQFDWMKQVFFPKKPISISCGDSFFVVVTEDYKVYTWGKNNYGQLGNSAFLDDRSFEADPKEIRILLGRSKIVKVACGSSHTVALTHDKNIVVWGRNNHGQLTYNFKENLCIPRMVTVTPKPMNILDVTAMKHMSCAIGEDKLIYVWGSCFDQEIRRTIACEYTTLFDVANALCARKPTEIKHLNGGEQSKILYDLENLYNDSEYSDYQVIVEGQTIYLHKSLLKVFALRCKSIGQLINFEDNPKTVNLNRFSYALYDAYFKYAYTGTIVLSLEKKFELLDMAKQLDEEKLKNSCLKAIKQEMKVATVFSIYNMAKEFNSMEVQEICFEFFIENEEYMYNANSWSKLDTAMQKKFKAKAKEAAATASASTAFTFTASTSTAFPSTSTAVPSTSDTSLESASSVPMSSSFSFSDSDTE